MLDHLDFPTFSPELLGNHTGIEVQYVSSDNANTILTKDNLFECTVKIDRDEFKIFVDSDNTLKVRRVV